MKSIAAIRRDYSKKELSESEVAKDPVAQFTTWWEEALKSELTEVNAMTLSTVDENNRPSARIVLLKDYSEEGFVFFTNYNSRKSRQLEANPYASLVFFWPELERQVRIEGEARKIDYESNDIYFRSRPFESRVGALASPQSEIIPGRNFIEEKFQELQEQLKDQDISCPPHWGGFRINPFRIEFWQGRQSRLHDRVCYIREGMSWKIVRLAP